MFANHIRNAVLALAGAALITTTLMSPVASAAPARAPSLDKDGGAAQEPLILFADVAAAEDLRVSPVLKFPDVAIDPNGWEQVGNNIHVKFVLRNLGSVPANNIHLEGHCNYLPSNYAPRMSRDPFQIGPGSTVNLGAGSTLWIWMVCPKTMAAGGGLLDNGVLEAPALPIELQTNNNAMIVDVYNEQPTSG